MIHEGIKIIIGKLWQNSYIIISVKKIKNHLTLFIKYDNFILS